VGIFFNYVSSPETISEGSEVLPSKSLILHGAGTKGATQERRWHIWMHSGNIEQRSMADGSFNSPILTTSLVANDRFRVVEAFEQERPKQPAILYAQRTRCRSALESISGEQ